MWHLALTGPVDSEEKFEAFFTIWVYETDDDEFRFNNASTHEGHLHQNAVLTVL